MAVYKCAVHYPDTDGRAACGRKLRTVIVTPIKEYVTCRACQKVLEYRKLVEIAAALPKDLFHRKTR